VSRFVTAAAISVTLLAWAGMVVHDLGAIRVAARQHEYLAAIQACIYVVLASILVYGSLVYLFARWGHLTRLRRHRAATDTELAEFREETVPAVTILVPSYKEDPRVVRKTILSAALQDYPRRSVVLLLDDPPVPQTMHDARALDDMRQIPADLARLLAPLRARIESAARAFEAARLTTSAACRITHTRLLADVLCETAEWFAQQARRQEIRDHTDALFVELTFLGESRRLQRHAADLMDRAGAGAIDVGVLRAEYRRLTERFDVTVRSFERKRYANLSHEPNKAMNLNSYLGLLGGAFEEHLEDGRLILRPASLSAAASLVIPDSEYILMLDADSILHPEYTIRLAHGLRQPEHRRVAVIQTPYSAFPGASSTLERVAGATTDVQYQIHQGFTHYDATFWVGANAMVRMRALREIAQTREERGYTIQTFIQDRTVIEDTESTVDLRHRGWQLHNYPERLAFSATPPDFGSLLIQRRRWANGGLLILSKLCRRGGRDGRPRMTLGEAVLRLHYLISLAASNVALLLLLAWGFDDRLASAWLPITAVPYYLLYAVDLRGAGYRRRDVFSVYALNILLIPVSLGGVLASLRQAWTGTRSVFMRTPKVIGRTAAPAEYIAVEAALLLSWVFHAGADLYLRRRINAGFNLGNAAFLLYAIVRFVGMREACEDLSPLLRVVRRRWAAMMGMWRAKTRRFATPVVVPLCLLLPAPAMGTEIAITFDDLPTHGELPPGVGREALVEAVVASLKRHGITGAVGFVNGGQLRVVPAYSAIVAKWVAAGYQLGNHTLSHIDLDRSEIAAYLADVDDNETALAFDTVRRGPRLFRYPYLHEGDTLDKRAAVRAALHARGYHIAPVTVLFSDWLWSEAYVRCRRRGDSDAAEAMKRGLLDEADAALDWSERHSRAVIGRPVKHIVLLHLAAIHGVVLDDLLNRYAQRGARFIPVADAMTDPIYAIDPGVIGYGNFLLQLVHTSGRRGVETPPQRFAVPERACR
jgi:cellulose synthase/poly-beta-1,6-N-acetylglucosamine synthase-like glycosyltransferase/peptidoglycan/xylan/chitin deacetylase (PgdA/CDA1 family)